MKPDSSLRVCAGRLLEHEHSVQGAATASQAQALLSAYTQLCVHFSRVLGRAGFEALFARSLRLVEARGAHPRASPATTDGGQLEALRAAVRPLGPDACRDYGVDLLSTFFALIVSFIGEPLTWRLLHTAWPDVLPSEPSNLREKK